MASGSVTASVSPDKGFKVYSLDAGSQFTGSVFVTGSVSASFFVGDGSQLTNVPAIVAPFIGSGSATGSVSSGDQFIVTTAKTGSQLGSIFTGSIEVSGSIRATDYLIGDGTYITNVFAQSSPKIESGSVTASVSPNFGFRVQTPFTQSQVGSQFTGSIEVSGSIRATQYLFGDGTFITNVQASAAPIIASGSSTASVTSGNTFVVTTGATGSAIGSRFTGSIDVSGSVKAFTFIGDGSQLTNVQASSAPFIASGSATASVQSGDTFIVITGATSGSAVGSQFTGSVAISGSISASLYVGDGGGLFNIPAAALQDLELNKIISGSAIAIISPNSGLNINTTISASLYFGDGGGLFNIPANALTDLKLDKIVSGSATASISPINGFRTNIFAAITGGIYVTGGNFVAASGSTYVKHQY